MAVDNVKYRADVDGLRALAVIPVVAYHMLLIPGGFVGVDVFFVISGYLISGIIFNDLHGETFSLAVFYERRVRRILPALYVVLATTLALAVTFMAPSDTVEVSRSALSALLSGSNVYFWLTSGYFETAATTAPLLHTWSLGVEEQFYLIFPALFLVWNRFRPGRFIELLLPIFVISLGFSIYGALQRETSAFYLLHSRAWEIMLGAMLATGMVRPLENRWMREGVALAGAAAIAVPVLFYSDRIAFPGLAALLPCFGAAAIIWTGQQPTFIRWGLSLKPVVAVGLISYSLYLWHWPVIVLQKAYWLFYTGQSRLIEKGLLLAICFMLAIASWWLVERPFRKRQVLAERRSLFFWAGGVGAALAIACVVVIGMAGLPQFLPGRNEGYSAWLAYDPALSTREHECLIDEEENLAKKCTSLSLEKPNVLIFGDSHAAHLWAGLASAYPTVNFLQVTASSCPPTQDALATFYPACRKALSLGISLIEGGQIDKVVLAGNWSIFGGEGGLEFARQLRAKGTDVVLFGPPPYYSRPLPRLLQLGQRTGDEDTPARFMKPGIFELDVEMAARAGRDGTPYISELAAWCPKRQCQTILNGAPIQFDSNHYTADGSVELIKRSGLLLPRGK